jgi:uncharacterized membrane protein
MTHSILSLEPAHRTLAQVADVTVAHPFRWLRAGWHDLRRAPAASIGYGALFTIASYLVTLWVVVTPTFYLLLPLLFGFFLVAPALAAGPYEISRRLEKGEKASLDHALGAIWSSGSRMMTLGALMALVLIAWVGSAAAIFAGVGEGLTPNLGSALGALLSVENLPLLLVGSAVGALFALVVFLLTAVAAPMLVDRDDVSVLEAMQTSVAACFYNWRPMLVWAALIAVCIGAGFITLYVALAIGFPVIGHATWHAYRDLVKQ